MPHVRVAAKAIVMRDGRLLVTRNVDAEGAFFLLPGGGQEHGESLPVALRREVMEEVGLAVEVHDLVPVRDYIARNHEFAREGDVHQLELFFRCTLQVDTLPSNGLTPTSGRQASSGWTLLDQTPSAFIPKCSSACYCRLVSTGLSTSARTDGELKWQSRRVGNNRCPPVRPT